MMGAGKTYANLGVGAEEAIGSVYAGAWRLVTGLHEEAWRYCRLVVELIFIIERTCRMLGLSGGEPWGKEERS